MVISVVDPGFLENGFICINLRCVCVGCFVVFYLNFLKYPMEMNEFSLKLFRFHRIFKNKGGGERGFKRAPEPPPLYISRDIGAGKLFLMRKIVNIFYQYRTVSVLLSTHNICFD